MSGGHWNYQSHNLRCLGDNLEEILEAVAQTEHLMDWAISGDTSRTEEEPKLWELWEKTFDELFGN